MLKGKGSSKGQIFTMDILAAVLGITIILGVAVQYQVMIKNRGVDAEYGEMKSIAEEAGQIAVKREAVKEHRANTIDSGSDLNSILDSLTGSKYDYEVRGAIQENSNTCDGREKVASSRRIVKKEDGEPGNLIIEVCSQ